LSVRLVFPWAGNNEIPAGNFTSTGNSVECRGGSGDDAGTGRKAMATQFRIGHGFDVHRFRRGRKLILGGVEIPSPVGLLGHSDADVVLHALINALLGAMGDGDIGSHFPDSDRRYKGIASAKLLAEVLAIMRRKRFKIVNVDVTLVAQRPKLSPHYPAMRRSVAGLLKLAVSAVSIKAATTEKLGWLGKGQGMAGTAVILLGR
jgi:2-C-methyl-D-erythritol 2,4-cyclodiphosphate synthase